MVVTPYREAADIIREEGGEILKLCYQCGLCTATCPWNVVKTFLPRKLIHQTQLGLTDFGAEEVWQCVGCRLCIDRCPRGVEVVDIMRALRRAVIEVGVGRAPDSLRIVMKNIAGTGNPLGEPQEKRADWAKDLGLKTHTPGTGMLYFPCCYQIYDPVMRKTALATVDIMKRVGADFGVLGNETVCCGESIRKAGSETLFQNLARTNIEAFKKAGVKKIVVSSPHCYHTFVEDYPEFGADFEVVCSIEYIAEFIREGKLKLTKELNKKITYHDSCCMGRWAGIYDEPRQVLASIPGLELVEMRENRESSLCCGGCAGMIWQDAKKGERLSEIRLEQAVEVGVDILAVACPYCRLNFESDLLSMDKNGGMEIKNIAELIQEAL